QTPGSGISILLVVGIPSTGSGNLYCQWELSPGSGNAWCILFPTFRSEGTNVLRIFVPTTSPACLQILLKGVTLIEPKLRTIVQVTPITDNLTMEELLQATTEGYKVAIVIREINADHFKIKINLVQLVQANPYHGFEKENPHTHIKNYKRITSTLTYRDVPIDVIRFMMFPYSLEGSARVLYDKEPHNSILTWEDLVNKFMNQLFPQRFEETFGEAYSLNTAASGNILSKTTREALQIIENKSKVCYSRNKLNVSRMNTASRENASKMDDRINKLADQISTLVDIFDKKVVTLAPVKAVEESCVVERETEETTDKGKTNFQGSTAHIQPPVRKKATNQIEKFFQIFQDFHFDISFAEALLLMPKFASTIKSLLTNKDKLFKLANIPLNENCLTMLLKKLPEKLGDLGKFLIPFDFLRMDVCHALADLGASINLMPLSIWKKLSLTELTPTRMTLELAVDALLIVPLILGRSFLSTGRTLTDVYGEEITLRVNDEVVTFNLNQTTRYFFTYDDFLVNRIDISDVTREEYVQEILGFSSGGNPTLTFEPILSKSYPSLTPFEGSDFILEEIKAYLKDESISLEIDHADCDSKGDICLIEKLLNNDPFQLPPMDLKQGEVVKAKSSIEMPLELELKDLPSLLEYAYLEAVDKLPVIIVKDLIVDENEALLKVLKSHKRAIS
nr:hypothetical protein [Tanacetum cinerariifolium]